MVVHLKDYLRPSGSQTPESRLGTNHIRSASFLPSLRAPLTPNFPSICKPGILYTQFSGFRRDLANQVALLLNSQNT